MMRSLVRALAVVAALLAAVAGTAAPATADHPTVSPPFAADSGDNCRYGLTQGTLAWAAIHPPEIPSVEVAGFIVDRPVPVLPTQTCPDDGLFTVATFRAFTGNLQVDAASQLMDNGSRRFAFRLAPDAAPVPIARIERVEVTVCRDHPLRGAPTPLYCGRTQIYFPTNAAG
jgi:hypothetical protein